MIINPKEIAQAAIRSGLLQPQQKPKPARSVAPKFYRKFKIQQIASACDEIEQRQGTNERVPYGLIEKVSRRLALNSQTVRNALGRRRQRLEAAP